MGEVVKLDQRRISIRDRMVADGKLLHISSVRDALAYGDGWQRAYSSLEAAHALAVAQWESSETLLRLANEELARIKEVTK